jgi:hypothetical protein
MEYLDKPDKDNSPLAHPAFWRGKISGIKEMLSIVSDIMLDKDNGSGSNNNADIENMRRALISWREDLRTFHEKKVDKKKTDV